MVKTKKNTRHLVALANNLLNPILDESKCRKAMVFTHGLTEMTSACWFVDGGIQFNPEGVFGSDKFISFNDYRNLPYVITTLKGGDVRPIDRISPLERLAEVAE